MRGGGKDNNGSIAAGMFAVGGGGPVTARPQSAVTFVDGLGIRRRGTAICRDVHGGWWMVGHREAAIRRDVHGSQGKSVLVVGWEGSVLVAVWEGSILVAVWEGPVVAVTFAGARGGSLFMDGLGIRRRRTAICRDVHGGWWMVGHREAAIHRNVHGGQGGILARGGLGGSDVRGGQGGTLSHGRLGGIRVRGGVGGTRRHRTRAHRSVRNGRRRVH